MILWILSCRVTAKADTLFTFYAKDHADARRQAEEFLKQHPSYERLDLKAYPSGFKIVMTHLPGTIEEDV
jgi:hypothetical protein